MAEEIFLTVVLGCGGGVGIGKSWVFNKALRCCMRNKSHLMPLTLLKNTPTQGLQVAHSFMSVLLLHKPTPLHVRGSSNVF